MRQVFARIAILASLAALSAPAVAIHIEPDQVDLQNPKTSLANENRAAERIINGGATSISSSAFTGFNAQGVKRKPFPPGFGLSGYEFEDEILRKSNSVEPAQKSAPKDQPAPEPAEKP